MNTQNPERKDESNLNVDEQNETISALEREASVHRARIGEKLGKLEEKISPEYMMDNAVGLVKEHGGELVDNAMGLIKEHGGDIAYTIQRTAKRSPLPLMLTGAGIAWFLVDQRNKKAQENRHRYASGRRLLPAARANAASYYSEESDHSRFVEAKNAAVNSLEEGWESTKSAAANVHNEARQYLSSAERQVHHAADNAQDHLKRASQRIEHNVGGFAESTARFMKEQPLVAGALGIALGAVLGGLLPTSSAERKFARQAIDSDTSRDMMEEVNSAVSSAKRSTQNVVSSAKKEVTNVVESAAQVAETKIDELSDRAKA